MEGKVAKGTKEGIKDMERRKTDKRKEGTKKRGGKGIMERKNNE